MTKVNSKFTITRHNLANIFPCLRQHFSGPSGLILLAVHREVSVDPE